MTVMPRIRAEQLLEFATTIYIKAGVLAEDARLAADTLVQADLWGHQSHGVMRLPWYVARLKSGVVKSVAALEYIVDAGAIGVIDGHDAMGQVLTALAAKDVIRRAKLHGIGAVALRSGLASSLGVLVALRLLQATGAAMLQANSVALVTTSAPKAIDRILSSFPADEQPQIRASLSESLKYCIAQRLLPAKEGRRQVAAFEVLKGTSNIGTMIRDEKTYQIYSAMQIGRSLGMQTFDEALKDLLRRNQISPETAYLAALKKEDFESMRSIR